jgi:hypothetical protein
MSVHPSRLLFVQRVNSLRRSRLLPAALAVGGSVSIGLQIVAGWSAGPILSQVAFLVLVMLLELILALPSAWPFIGPYKKRSLVAQLRDSKFVRPGRAVFPGSPLATGTG